MTIARIYRMDPAAGQAAALHAALEALAHAVRPLPGCEGVLLYAEEGSGFLFVEHWASVEAHKAAAPSLPKAALAPVFGLLSGPPESRSCAMTLSL